MEVVSSESDLESSGSEYSFPGALESDEEVYNVLNLRDEFLLDFGCHQNDQEVI